jgi:nucleotide-binding universal stress UspA family protein
MGRIVVGIDGSPGSAAALRWAIDEAACRGGEVEAVAVWQYPYSGDWGVALVTPADLEALESQTARMLDEAIAEACPDEDRRAEVKRTVVQGAPAWALLDIAHDADLLVVGARGRGGFLGLLLGSVSTQCVHHAPCPVVVVPSPDEQGRRSARRSSGERTPV